MSRFVRKVRTGSGATAVQIVTKHGRQVSHILHLGSANTPTRLKFLLQLAKNKLYEGQKSLFAEEASPTIVQEQIHSRYLYDQLLLVYQGLGFGALSDPLFVQLVVARIVEPTSKLDTIRVISELGLTPPSKDQIYRCLKRVIKHKYRSQLSRLCLQAANPQHLSLLLYDVTTLYFETQQADEFRKPGLSKERRLEPQIVVGLLVDRSGFPLSMQEFEGNLGETKTILPTITKFCEEHQVETKQMTVTADAGMLSAKNLGELEDEGLSFIVGSRLNKTPYDIKEWQKENPAQELEDGQIFETTQTFGKKKEEQVERRVIYQYRKKRAKLDLLNIEKQITKAKRIVEGKTPLKKATFVTITQTKQTKPTLNLELINEHQLRAGIKGYVTNLPTLEEDPKRGASPQEVIFAYHQLFQVEKSFRMSKSDLKARPIFHHKLDSIRAHLTIVFAALAIARHIEDKTKLSIRRFVRTLRPIQTGTVIIMGKRYQTEPLITDRIKQLTNQLMNGH